MKHYIINQLHSLTSIPSPSGYTKNVCTYVANELSNMNFTPVFSKKGNISVTLGGEGSPLVLAAHLDTLGAMVRSIKENGHIRLTALGGHEWATCDGENCQLITRSGKIYTGVILNTEPSVHVKKEAPEKTDETMELLLDENVSSREDVLALGIQNGDIVSLDPRTVVTESGFIKSRFLDDKLASSILLGLAKDVKEGNVILNRKVTLLFTVHEEVGHGGCVLPEDTEEMISVDIGCIGDDLSCKETMVSICSKDSLGPYDYDITSKLISLAKENHIDYAVDIYPYYVSDADAALKSGYDIRHGLIGPGVYSSHHYERSHIDGAINTLSLLKAYVQ